MGNINDTYTATFRNNKIGDTIKMNEEISEDKVSKLSDRFGRYICDDCKAKMEEELAKCGNAITRTMKTYSIMKKSLCKKCERKLVKQVLKQGVQ